MVFFARQSNSAISLLVFPSLTRLATLISMGVRLKNLKDNLLIKGEIILFKLESKIFTRVSWLVFK